jgi:hypothetical protein
MNDSGQLRSCGTNVFDLDKPHGLILPSGSTADSSARGWVLSVVRVTFAGGRMARLTLSAGTFPLVAGIAAATALSGAAVFTVFRSGCDSPGVYRAHDGVIELVGGCLNRADLPALPERQTQRPLGIAPPQP